MHLCLQAIYASVIPGDVMRGAMSGMIAFPSWLGKNSSKTKTDRMLQDLKSHMKLKYVVNIVSLLNCVPILDCVPVKQ